MGKKYIIELLDDCPSEFKGIIVFGLTPNGQIAAEPIPVEDLTPYTEPDLEQVKRDYDAWYEKGLADAWEAVKKLARMDTDTSESITGYFGLHNIMHNLTASEVIEEIRAYEQAQKEKEEQIQIGDEVDWMGDKYVVIYVRREAKKADLISCQFGSACENVAFSALGKTGRHFDELATILEKMREEREQ